MTMEPVETTEPTQTPPKVWDYVFHTETKHGYIIVKIDADSKEEAIKMAKKEFDEHIWTPDIPVYIGKFEYEYHGEDVDITTERGEVVDFSSIQ
jgi:hypothetical protein